MSNRTQERKRQALRDVPDALLHILPFVNSNHGCGCRRRTKQGSAAEEPSVVTLDHTPPDRRLLRGHVCSLVTPQIPHI